MESVDPGVQPQTFEEWCERCQKEIPHFKFWYTTLQLELLVLIYVKSLRTANFSLYIDCLTKLAPWFFCLVTFAQHFKSLIEEMGNPFLEDSKDNTRDIADTAVASSVCCAEETGKNQY